MKIDRLKILREKMGLNQKEFAVKVNIPYSTYNNYEIGTREPDLETLTKLADFFNVSIDYLLGKTNSKELYIIKDELPIELKEAGIDYIEVVKEAKESGLTPSEISELIQLAKKFKR